MLQKHSSAQRGQLRLAAAFVFAGFLSFAPTQAQASCDTALQTGKGILDLQAGSPATFEKGVAEWESEILKIRVSQPGVLILGLESGAGADGYLLAGETSSARLINGAPLDSWSPLLTLVAPKTVYCLRVVPKPGAEGSLRIRVELIDLCRLGASSDDDGDSFACATDIHLKDHRAGSISKAGDLDVFAFSLAARGTVDIQSGGGTDVSGRLFDEKGTLMAEDDDKGPGLGFLISKALPAGRYYVRVEGTKGATGAYTLSLDEAP